MVSKQLSLKSCRFHVRGEVNWIEVQYSWRNILDTSRTGIDFPSSKSRFGLLKSQASDIVENLKLVESDQNEPNQILKTTFSSTRLLLALSGLNDAHQYTAQGPRTLGRAFGKHLWNKFRYNLATI